MGKTKHPLTPEERQQKDEQKKREETEQFMKGRPNRAEVANYVNSLLEEKYMPEIQRLIGTVQNSTQLGFMTLQAILINKGICTGDEIQQVTKEFIQAQKAEMEKMKKKLQEKTSEVKDKAINSVE